MPNVDAAAILQKVLTGFERRRPMRAGSLIVTVFGDAIVPHGGSLWLGSLLDIMAAFGVEPGLVRTALSRLVSDGWFERNRPGRNSYYRLSPKGEAEFAAATRRIYHLSVEPWDGSLQLALLSSIDTKDRLALRDRLAVEGFGQASPTVLLRGKKPGGEAVPEADGVIWLTASVQGQDSRMTRALGETCWQLDELATSYRRFISAFGPLASDPEAMSNLSDAAAFQLRILLIHDYRRIVLRDPLLPLEMLPLDWPGTIARALCRELYRANIDRSERWLANHATGEGGPLPVASAAFATRFAND